MGAKYNVFVDINEPKFDRVMTFSPHKGMDLAKICVRKMVYWTTEQSDFSALKAGFHFGEFGRATKRWECQGMRSLKSKLKASVYWRTRGQFWKLNQVQLFCDQNERKPIRFLLFNAKECDRTGSRD